MLGYKDFAKLYAEQNGCSVSEAERITHAVLNAVKTAIITDGGVAFKGLFNISRVTRKEKSGKNPATGEPMTIPQHDTLKISVSKLLKEELN